jgi:predicted HicB family RNase H-like nuclease
MKAETEQKKPVIIPERIHRELKIKATQEGKKLEQMTAELLEMALKLKAA